MVGQYASNSLRYLMLILILIQGGISSYSVAGDNNSGTSTIGMNVTDPESIHCQFFYRSSERKSHELKQGVTLKKNTPVKIKQGEFRITASYMDYEGDSPGLIITVKHATTGKKLSHTLYQFESLSNLRNEFSGGHGFTGLHYIYAPNSEAELQYFCTIESNSASRR